MTIDPARRRPAPAPAGLPGRPPAPPVHRRVRRPVQRAPRHRPRGPDGPRARRSALDALVDRLNATYLDWLFTRAVVGGRAGGAPGELDGRLPQLVRDRARGRARRARSSRSRTRAAWTRGSWARRSARPRPAARRWPSSRAATAPSPAAERHGTPVARSRPAAPSRDQPLRAGQGAARGPGLHGQGRDQGVRHRRACAATSRRWSWSSRRPSASGWCFQGIDRLAMTDAVYVAVGAWPTRQPEARRLCRRLGLGLIVVTHGRARGRAGPGAVPAAQEPAPDGRTAPRAPSAHRRPDGGWIDPPADHDGLPAGGDAVRGAPGGWADCRCGRCGRQGTFRTRAGSCATTSTAGSSGWSAASTR